MDRSNMAVAVFVNLEFIVLGLLNFQLHIQLNIDQLLSLVKEQKDFYVRCLTTSIMVLTKNVLRTNSHVPTVFVRTPSINSLKI